jgi:hypothetical protein
LAVTLKVGAEAKLAVVSTYRSPRGGEICCFRVLSGGDSGEEPSVDLYECPMGELEEKEGAAPELSPSVGQAAHRARFASEVR